VVRVNLYRDMLLLSPASDSRAPSGFSRVFHPTPDSRAQTLTSDLFAPGGMRIHIEGDVQAVLDDAEMTLVMLLGAHIPAMPRLSRKTAWCLLGVAAYLGAFQYDRAMYFSSST
jgi:hypothetical protein